MRRHTNDVVSYIKKLLIEDPYRTRDELLSILELEGHHRVSEFTLSSLRRRFLDDCRFLKAQRVCDIWKGKPKRKPHSKLKPKRRFRIEQQKAPQPRRVIQGKDSLERSPFWWWNLSDA